MVVRAPRPPLDFLPGACCHLRRNGRGADPCLMIGLQVLCVTGCLWFRDHRSLLQWKAPEGLARQGALRGLEHPVSRMTLAHFACRAVPTPYIATYHRDPASQGETRQEVVGRLWESVDARKIVGRK